MFVRRALVISTLLLATLGTGAQAQAPDWKKTLP